MSDKKEKQELKVFISSRDSKCDECGQDLGRHACRKYSGRVGRCAAAKDLDQDAIRLAVRAHVRHAETNYDKLRSSMVGRSKARAMVHDKVADVLKQWTAVSR